MMNKKSKTLDGKKAKTKTSTTYDCCVMIFAAVMFADVVRWLVL
jgi:hypothetical protein